MAWETLRVGRVTGFDWSAKGALSGLDPYLAWLDETGPNRHLPLRNYQGCLPVALEAPDAAIVHGLDACDVITLPQAYRDEMLRHPREGHFCCTALIKPSADVLSNLKQGKVKIDLGLPQVIPGEDEEAPVTRSRTRATELPVGLTRSEVVIGIIDDGCAFAHDEFCYRGSDGTRRTRVEWLWDQGEAAPSSSRLWQTPSAFGYGREASNDRLDALMAEAAEVGAAGLEDVAYARAQHHLPHDRASHGVAVMGLAAGRNNFFTSTSDTDAAAGAQIVFVQLPRAAVDDTSAGWLSVHVQDALAYIFEKAGKRPVVVNLSFGGQAGPHDGSSVLERAIDRMLEIPNRAVVVAAGNGREMGCHANFPLAGHGAAVSLVWGLEPDDPSDSFLELRVQRKKDGKPVPVEVRVTPFGQHAGSNWVKPGAGRVWRRDGEPLSAVFNSSQDEEGNDPLVLVCAAPSVAQPFEPSRPPVPYGPWTIEVRTIGPEPVTVDAWIERDDSPFGRRRLRQSRFQGPSTSVKGTLSSIATGFKTIVVGGCLLSDGSMASYSASGPTRNHPPREGVTLAAPSGRTLKQDTIEVLGPRTGTRAFLDGTSMAAPLATRQVAEILAARKKPMTAEQIRRALIDLARAAPAGADVNAVGAGLLVPRT